ncbi:hypothetical protein P853_03138 [Enterobacter hormaechei subsp. hoffmannii UCI 50]|uniref:Uncharacterized protein n=1 Tax=Klebsiella michiganensis TaxID=1134687 RepID=A0A0J2KMC6_9ENTR|nr:hypothetical protein P853_03138 [Enterobacter hormaechei subsp. hoffmannii UCI 50]EWF64221.1 hypothetical protein L387_04743 [Klebsiella michiganensis]CAE7771577.1 hypothetical protein AI2797V1_0511 [Enterobacter cloacae]CZY52198.1 Uncharacterised protein [Enterobacter hormaechei]SAD55868.1 Uncharacterised protein [Enterobacter roggenkampii]SAQ46560.1 Uncharacterised protein [Klebsiella oxytoca]
MRQFQSLCQITAANRDHLSTWQESSKRVERTFSRNIHYHSCGAHPFQFSTTLPQPGSGNIIIANHKNRGQTG